MPKIRIRGNKPKGKRAHHSTYSRGIKLRKKNGHTHEVVEEKNTKGMTISRCKICKYHFF